MQVFMSTLGAELTAVTEGGVEIRLPFSSNLTQQNGYLHAGVITSILDSACGYAALTVAADDKEVLTVELKVNLLAPATGEVFAARCFCHHRRRREDGCNHAGHNHGCADNPREITQGSAPTAVKARYSQP
jgi:uncharacterized protein (TIGR00369 family)